MHLWLSFHLKLTDMALFGFIKPPSHQRYEYKPRFWDPEKEELKERLERGNGDPEAAKSRISEHFSRRSTRGGGYSKYRHKEITRSNLRLAMVLAIIIFIAYLFLVALPDFLTLFE